MEPTTELSSPLDEVARLDRRLANEVARSNALCNQLDALRREYDALADRLDAIHVIATRRALA